MNPRRRYSTNPIMLYLQHHRWEWVSISTIKKATGCTQRDFEELLTRKYYKWFIERKGAKLRYIGSPLMVYKVVVELRNAYPEWLSADQLTARLNINSHPSQIISRWTNLVPVETSYYDGGKWAKHIKVYRYIPNDPRSLVDYQYATTSAQIKAGRREKIYALMQKYPGIYFTAAEISARLRFTCAEVSANNLIVLMRDHPAEIVTDVDTEHNRLRYAYISPAVAESRQLKPMEIKA